MLTRTYLSRSLTTRGSTGNDCEEALLEGIEGAFGLDEDLRFKGATFGGSGFLLMGEPICKLPIECCDGARIPTVLLIESVFCGMFESWIGVGGAKSLMVTGQGGSHAKSEQRTRPEKEMIGEPSS